MAHVFSEDADFGGSKRKGAAYMGAIASLQTAVSSVTGSASSNAAAAPQQNQPQQTQAQVSTSAYTVQLTEAQQVYQLYNQGLPVTQIASSLSLSVAAVNSYLSLSNSEG
jgi:DNA-binding NarL/FixJ family response regulator